MGCQGWSRGPGGLRAHMGGDIGVPQAGGGTAAPALPPAARAEPQPPGNINKPLCNAVGVSSTHRRRTSIGGGDQVGTPHPRVPSPSPPQPCLAVPGGSAVSPPGGSVTSRPFRVSTHGCCPGLQPFSPQKGGCDPPMGVPRFGAGCGGHPQDPHLDAGVGEVGCDPQHTAWELPYPPLGTFWGPQTFRGEGAQRWAGSSDLNKEGGRTGHTDPPSGGRGGAAGAGEAVG